MSIVQIVKRTSSLILAVPIAVMYFWSIYGAWSWIPMKLSGEFDFYESMMFVVNIDEYYLEMLLAYSLFIVIFTQYIKNVANRFYNSIDTISERRVMILNNIDRLGDSGQYKFIIACLIFVFVYLSSKDLRAALSQGVSAYQLSRFDSSLGGMGSAAAFFGDTFLYLAIPLLFSTKQIKNNLFVATLILFYFGVNLLLGNRNTLLCGLAIGIMLYAELNGIKSTFKPKYIVIMVCSLVAIQLISFVRGMSIDVILSGNYDFGFGDILNSTSKSQEQHAAQISMYGVLKNDVPCTFGTSILFLISTLIPAFLGVPRPDRIYTYYTMMTMNGRPDIGVTLHHATAWYLNFGIFGIVAGALIWGYVFKYLYERRYKYNYFYGVVIFSAVSIQMIRDSGPESYKGCLLLATIIPMFIVSYCLKHSNA